MTRKAWSHVRILIYRTWAIVPGLASGTEVLDRAQPSRQQLFSRLG